MPNRRRPPSRVRPPALIRVAIQDGVVEIEDQPPALRPQERRLPSRQQLPLEDHGVILRRVPELPDPRQGAASHPPHVDRPPLGIEGVSKNVHAISGAHMVRRFDQGQGLHDPSSVTAGLPHMRAAESSRDRPPLPRPILPMSEKLPPPFSPIPGRAKLPAPHLPPPPLIHPPPRNLVPNPSDPPTPPDPLMIATSGPSDHSSSRFGYDSRPISRANPPCPHLPPPILPPPPRPILEIDGFPLCHLFTTPLSLDRLAPAAVARQPERAYRVVPPWNNTTIRSSSRG